MKSLGLGLNFTGPKDYSELDCVLYSHPAGFPNSGTRSSRSSCFNKTFHSSNGASATVRNSEVQGFDTHDEEGSY